MARNLCPTPPSRTGWMRLRSAQGGFEDDDLTKAEAGYSAADAAGEHGNRGQGLGRLAAERPRNLVDRVRPSYRVAYRPRTGHRRDGQLLSRHRGAAPALVGVSKRA